jgi:hypothetical protein
MLKSGGHPNIVKAFNAKMINAAEHLHSGFDLSNLINKDTNAQFYK